MTCKRLWWPLNHLTCSEVEKRDPVCENGPCCSSCSSLIGLDVWNTVQGCDVSHSWESCLAIFRLLVSGWPLHEKYCHCHCFEEGACRTLPHMYLNYRCLSIDCCRLPHIRAAVERTGRDRAGESLVAQDWEQAYGHAMICKATEPVSTIYQSRRASRVGLVWTAPQPTA
jgi:hypothetical protein